MGAADQRDHESADDRAAEVGDAFGAWVRGVCEAVERSIDPVKDWTLADARARVCDIAVDDLGLVTGAMARIIADLGWTLPARNPVHFGVFPQEWGFAGIPEFFREDVRRQFPDGVSPKVRSILEVAVKDFSEQFGAGLTVEMIAALCESSGQWADLHHEILRQASLLSYREDRPITTAPVSRKAALAVVSLCESAIRWLIVARFAADTEGEADRAAWPVAVARHWGQVMAHKLGRAAGDESVYWNGDSLPELTDQVRLARRR